MKILTRHASAINTSNLEDSPHAYMRDVNILGAMGLASRVVPLGVALSRMLSGGKASEVVDILTDMAIKHARYRNTRITDVQAGDIAKAVLGWYRGGTCQPCGGRGYMQIENTPVQGDQCPRCQGAGRIEFDSHFSRDTLPIAQWLADRIEAEQAQAGREAMRKLSPLLDL